MPQKADGTQSRAVQLWQHVRIPEDPLEILLPGPHPKPVKSAPTGVVPRHQGTSMCQQG